MKKITALFCIAALAFAMCVCVSAASLAFNDQTLIYAVEDDLPAEPVTVEIKLRIPSGVVRGTFFGNYQWDETSNNIDFGIGRAGNPVVRIRDDEKTYQYIFSDKTVAYNTWVHLTLVRDVANKKMHCYVDGTLTQSLDMTESYEALSKQDYKIGANNVYMNPEYFKGEMMSLAVYSDVRTAAEVKKDATSTTIDKSGLMLYYDFFDAANFPATVADKSGNGNDAIRNRMFTDESDMPAIDYAYTFAVIGDTQNMAKHFSDHFNDIYNYIYDKRDAMNIEAVIGVGDITDTRNHGTIESEWDVALKGLQIIDDITLNIPIIGNHDNPYWYNKTVSNLNYADISERYLKHDLRDTYIEANIGGVPYLFIQLQHGANDDVLAWANNVAKAHPNHNIIVSTHGYTYYDGTTLDEGDQHNSDMTNMAEAIWEKFVSKHSNIVLVLSGHIGYDYAVVNQRKGVNGNTVTEMLFDFQSSDNASVDYGLSENGLGVVSLLHFSADGKTITVRNYSTVLEKYFMEINQFTLEVDTASNKTYVKPNRAPTPPREEEVETDEPVIVERPTVIYKNDFSNASTLSDFTQYRAKWEIKNGGLYLTSTAIGGASSADYGHIIYNGAKNLENYMIDVDLYNAYAQAGVIFRAHDETLSHETYGFNGYYTLVGDSLENGAIAGAINNNWVSALLDNGSTNTNGGRGVNLHFNVVVEDALIKVVITNKDTGKTLYNGMYLLGSKKEADPHYFMGSFGLRMRAKYGSYTAVGKSYFDNLVVTSIPKKPITNIVPVDTSDAEVVYTNSFDSASALNDFTQYYGTWEVKNGRLYLTSVSKTASLLLYSGSKFKNLTDYVVDVDMYNMQSQAGVVIRSDLDRVTGTKTGSDFYGYLAFVAIDGKKAAIGYGLTDGSWGGNIKVSDGVTTPGSDVHLNVAVSGDTITYRLSNIDSGKLLWEHTEHLGLYESGTFGFRVSSDVNGNGTGNVNTIALDNLVVSKLTHHCEYSDWIVEKEATYTATGKRYRMCIVCDKEDAETLPKLEKLDVNIEIDSVSVDAGNTFSVAFKVKNTVGYSSLSFELPIDTSVLTFKSISASNLPTGFSVSSRNVIVRNGKITVSYAGSEPFAGEVSFTASFATKYSVKDITSVFAVNNAKASYTHPQGTVVNATINVAGGVVSIIGQIPPLGDVDLNGKVDTSDVVNAVRAITSGEYVEEADFNGDGKISLIDVLTIVKQLIK